MRADSASTCTRGRGLPRTGCPLLGHDPPAAERARADRGDPGSGLDADPVRDSGRRRCRRDDLHPVPAQGGGRSGAAHRAAREAAARLTAGSLCTSEPVLWLLRWDSLPLNTARVSLAATSPWRALEDFFPATALNTLKPQFPGSRSPGLGLQGKRGTPALKSNGSTACDR